MVVGGALAQLVSWRAGFFLNVPIGIVMIVMALRCVPKGGGERGRFDLIGALTSTVGVGALVFGIVQSSSAGWGSPTTLGSLGLAAVLIVWLVMNEGRAEQPIMPLSLFSSSARSGSYVARLLFAGCLSFLLADRYNARVDSVTISPSQIPYLGRVAEKCVSGRVRPVLGDALDPTWWSGEPYTAIFGMDALCQVGRYPELAKGFATMQRHGGIVAISDHFASDKRSSYAREFDRCWLSDITPIGEAVNAMCTNGYES